MSKRKAELSQFFTPAWAASMLLQRHFPRLNSADTVVDAGCGDGRFLMAVPADVDAYGIEIDPHWAEQARLNSGREVLLGDFTQLALPRAPTVVVGNPPFKSAIITAFLARCHEIMEYGGQVGFLLPAYYLQTAGTVMRLNRKFSIEQEMLPRNMFESMTKPIVWATFTKSQRTVLSGFFLYAETDALDSLKPEAKALFVGNESSPTCWKDAVEMALQVCGGQATLQQIYQCLENKRPTANPWWREKVRQIAGRHFTRVQPGEYALVAA